MLKRLHLDILENRLTPTFPLADDAMDEPVRRLREVLGTSPDSADFWVLEHGEGRDAPPLVA
mgnify:CR=1 FL=1